MDPEPLPAAPLLPGEPEPRPAAPHLPGGEMVAQVFVLVAILQLTVSALLQYLNLPFGLVWSEVFLFLAPVWLVSRGLGYAPTELLSFRPKPPWWALPVGMLVGVANYPLAGGLEAVVRAMVPERFSGTFDASHVFTSVSGLQLAGVVVAVSVFAPICEEAAYRGFAQRLLMQRNRPGMAIGITAVVFSAMHWDPIGFVARVELGVLFGLLAWWTGTLWTSIAAHAASNALATGLFLALGDDTTDTRPEILELLGLCMLGAALTVPLMVAVHRYGRREAAPVPYHGPDSGMPRRVASWVGVGLASVGIFAILRWKR